MEDNLNGITNGALVNRAADERNPYESRLRAGRRAVQEYAGAGDCAKLETVYCDGRLPVEVRVEAGLELVRLAAERGQDIRVWHLKASTLREVSEAASRAIGEIAGGGRPRGLPAVAAGRERAVARA